MPWYGRVVIALGIVASFLVLALIVASLREIERVPAAPPAAAEAPPPVDDPLSDAEIRQCAECHTDACRDFFDTPHMRTLTNATGEPVFTRFLGSDGRGRAVDGTLSDFHYRRRGDALEAVGSPEEHRVIVDWIFGSGTRSQTPVAWSSTSIGSAEGLELHLSWYPGIGLSRTFDHEGRIGSGLESLGIYESPETLFACFDCHSTGLQAVEGQPPLFEGFLPGVRCDKCHDRARLHLESAGVATMERWSDLTPAESIERCATCHRSPTSDAARKYAADDPKVTRFAPIGLSRSACFIHQDSRRLDCTTCHDPHEPPPTEMAVYNAQCLRCHSTPASACPDQPETSSCVDCHMPKRSVDRYLAFTDHWIRAPVAGRSPLETMHDALRRSPHASPVRAPLEAPRP